MRNIKPSDAKNIWERSWLVPYMGDSSIMAAAAIRNFNVNARVIPTDIEGGYELAQKHIQSEVCYPLKGVTADVLDYISKKVQSDGKKFVEDNYFVIIPTTCGPCRFGKYQEVIRACMDGEGFENVPIGGPTTETDYNDVLNDSYSKRDKIKFQQILIKGVISSDLLDDITLRVRPYAEDKQQLNELKNQRLGELEDIVERGAEIGSLVNWGKETVAQFGKQLHHQERFPLVVYAGEIYMRQHDPYTGNVVLKLENQGLEVVRTPTMEWVDYVNRLNRIESVDGILKGLGEFKLGRVFENAQKWFSEGVKGAYTNIVHKKISEPFHDILKGRHVFPNPLNIIKMLEKNNEFDRKIEGESPLSIGIAYCLMNDIFPQDENVISGMFHVGPFTCMQEIVATAKIEGMAKELRKTKPNLLFPIIHGFFGDSPNPNLDSEIAVFREQCYQKKRRVGNKE